MLLPSNKQLMRTVGFASSDSQTFTFGPFMPTDFVRDLYVMLQPDDDTAIETAGVVLAIRWKTQFETLFSDGEPLIIGADGNTASSTSALLPLISRQWVFPINAIPADTDGPRWLSVRLSGDEWTGNLNGLLVLAAGPVDFFKGGG